MLGCLLGLESGTFDGSATTACQSAKMGAHRDSIAWRAIKIKPATWIARCAFPSDRHHVHARGTTRRSCHCLGVCRRSRYCPEISYHLRGGF
jgi:hypothetical protein